MLDDGCEVYFDRNLMLLNPVARYMLQKGIEEGIEQGIEQGIVQAKLETAKNMLDEGFSIEQIVKITGLPEEAILNIE